MYFFLRACVIPILFISWVPFQLFVKKQKWANVEGDARVIAFFLLLWALIYFVWLQ